MVGSLVSASRYTLMRSAAPAVPAASSENTARLIARFMISPLKTLSYYLGVVYPYISPESGAARPAQAGQPRARAGTGAAVHRPDRRLVRADGRIHIAGPGEDAPGEVGD